MKKYKFTLYSVIQKDYEIEGNSRDEVEEIALKETEKEIKESTTQKYIIDESFAVFKREDK